MQDVIFIAILTAFFALTVVFVKACERVIGPDIEAERTGNEETTGAEDEPAAA